MNILSVQNQYWRSTGLRFSANEIKREALELPAWHDPNLLLSIHTNHQQALALNKHIRLIEDSIVNQVKLRGSYRNLLTVTGIGPVLGLTIMLETGEVSRFRSAGHYASYCRCVDSERLSNGKKKGSGNRKNGNKYLAWAYVEAASIGRRFNGSYRAWFDRKKKSRNTAIATKALAHKLSRACFYIMRDAVEFNEEKLFG